MSRCGALQSKAYTVGDALFVRKYIENNVDLYDTYDREVAARYGKPYSRGGRGAS